MHPSAAAAALSLDDSDPLKAQLLRAAQGYASPRDYFIRRASFLLIGHHGHIIAPVADRIAPMVFRIALVVFRIVALVIFRIAPMVIPHCSDDGIPHCSDGPTSAMTPRVHNPLAGEAALELALAKLRLRPRLRAFTFIYSFIHQRYAARSRLAEGVATICAAFWPRPVIVRLSDFKSNGARAPATVLGPI